MQGADDFHAVAVGQAQVGDDELEFAGGRAGDAVPGAAGKLDAVAARRQQQLDARADARIVFDDQNAFVARGCRYRFAHADTAGRRM